MKRRLEADEELSNVRKRCQPDDSRKDVENAPKINDSDQNYSCERQEDCNSDEEVYVDDEIEDAFAAYHVIHHPDDEDLDNWMELRYAIKMRQMERMDTGHVFMTLHNAALHGQSDTVQTLLDNGSCPNTQDSDGDTPLHKAAEKGHFSVVECLVKIGADLRIENKKGLEPIHVAARNGYKDIVEYLINNNVSVDECDRNCCTPLHHAACKGHLNVIDYLVDKGACVNAMSTTGTKMIQVANTKYYKDIVKFLEVKKQNVHKNYEQCCGSNKETLYYESENDHTIRLNVVVEKGVPSSKCCRVSQLLKMELCYTETGMKLLDEFIADSNHLLILDPNFDCEAGNTPLHEAAKEGYLDIVECLVKNGAHTNLNNSIGVQPIHIAARNGNKNIVEFLLANNVKVDQRDEFGWTALHHAADNCHLSIMEYLVNNGADVKARTDMHILPLHIGAMCRPLIDIPTYKGNWYAGQNLNSWRNRAFQTASFSMDQSHQYSDRDKLCEASSMVMDFLISKDGGVNDADRNGLLPLHYALIGEMHHIVQKLIEAGTKTNMQDRVGKTPLHIAARNGFLDIEKMIDKETNLNVQDNNGNTPLHSACMVGRRRIMTCLLKAGAKSDIQNNTGRTVLHYYVSHRFCKCQSAFDDGPPVEIVRKVCDQVCADGSMWSSAMHLFIDTNEDDTAFFKQLLQNQKDLNVKDMNGKTMMTYAVLDWLYHHEEWCDTLFKLLVDHGAYFKGTDFRYLAQEKKEILFQDIEMCLKSISNKFNNHYLPLLYRHPVRLPPMDKLVISPRQLQAIEKIVKAEIKENGYCDVTKIQYPSLAMLAVKSYVSHVKKVASEKD